jgi:protein-disulfide isomerase
MMSGSLMFSLLGLSALGQPDRAAVRPVGSRPAYFLTALGIVCVCAGFVNGIGAGRISTINEAAVARTSATKLLVGHRLGPPGAPTVIAFSDLCCSACAFEIPSLARLASEGKIVLVFRHFPFVRPNVSGYLAVASELAARKGAFWHFIESVYQRRISSPSDATAVAQEFGIYVPFNTYMSMERCRKARETIRADIVIAESMEIRGTPTLILIKDGNSPKAMNVAQIEFEVGGGE